MSMQLTFFFENFDKVAASGHFGCPKFTFDRISGHFRSIGHFGFPKFTLDRNSGYFMSENHFGSHFWPFQIHTELYFFFKLFTKWPLAAILDVRKELSIAFLAISDRYATLFFWIFF